MKNKILQFAQMSVLIIILILAVLAVIFIPKSISNYFAFAVKGASIGIAGYIVAEFAPIILSEIVLLIVFAILTKHMHKNGSRSLLKGKFGFIKKIPVVARIIIGLGVIFCVFTLILYVVQDAFVYTPTDGTSMTRQVLKHQEMSEVNLDEGKISGLAYSKSSSQCLLFFGGNAQNAASFFKNFYKNGFDILIDNTDILYFDYPGYGKNQGKPTEKDIYQMALSAYSYAKENYSTVYVAGFSLGSGVAAYVSAERNPLKVFLIAPYTSMTDVYNTFLPIFYGPYKYIVKNKYPSIKYIGENESETLIFASKTDEVIPYEFSLRLYESVTEKAKMFTMDDKSHNEIVFDESVWEIIKNEMN